MPSKFPLNGQMTLPNKVAFESAEKELEDCTWVKGAQTTPGHQEGSAHCPTHRLDSSQEGTQQCYSRGEVLRRVGTASKGRSRGAYRMCSAARSCEDTCEMLSSGKAHQTHSRVSLGAGAWAPQPGMDGLVIPDSLKERGCSGPRILFT